MEQLAIFSATLGLSPPWHVIAANFAENLNRLDISVEYAHAGRLACPHCGEKGAGPATDTKVEVWFHGNFFGYVTYLHARVPMITCGCGNTFPSERPWGRAGSHFSRVL
jgi:transposase